MEMTPCVYLMLNFEFIFEAGTTADGLSFSANVLLKKSSTGVAKMNNIADDTSNTPVPTNVCFSNLTTGLTWRNKIIHECMIK